MATKAWGLSMGLTCALLSTSQPPHPPLRRQTVDLANLTIARALCEAQTTAEHGPPQPSDCPRICSGTPDRPYPTSSASQPLLELHTPLLRSTCAFWNLSPLPFKEVPILPIDHVAFPRSEMSTMLKGGKRAPVALFSYSRCAAWRSWPACFMSLSFVDPIRAPPDLQPIHLHWYRHSACVGSL